jgi:hypothetical protein
VVDLDIFPELSGLGGIVLFPEHAVAVSEVARSILRAPRGYLQATGRSDCRHCNLGSGGVVTKLCVGHGSSYRHEDRLRGRRFHFGPPLRLQRVMSSRAACLSQVSLSASSSAMPMVALFGFAIGSFLYFFSCREGVKWQSFQIRAKAVAREFTKVTETRVNGAAAKVEGRKLEFEELGNAFTTASVAHPEKHAAPGFSAWIEALATAVLALEKQRRLTVDVHKPVELDTLRRGKLVENDLVYRQTFVIRSYEAGFDKIASIETISNLFQAMLFSSHLLACCDVPSYV